MLMMNQNMAELNVNVSMNGKGAENRHVHVQMRISGVT